MNIMKQVSILLGCSVIVLGSSMTLAKEQSAISLKMQTFDERLLVQEDGTKLTTLVPIDSQIPGKQVTYVIEYKNIGDKKVDKGAVISTDALPKHTFYVAKSAFCQNCDISFSINGVDYDQLENLKVPLGKGKTRPANHKDVKKVRWQLNRELDSKSQGSVGYKLQINDNTL
jgi:uncharacterized repeat protein (TIGR01451 family)